MRIRIGSNTTIVGVGKNATLRGAWFDVAGSKTDRRKNIIIRNLNFQDTYDCFPAWSPTDGEKGAWNAEYDAVSLRYADNVWIDHNRFEDLATADSGEPVYFGVHYERHDGLTDITNVSDLVTVSWNQYRNHDKLMLIGSSDSPKDPDTGKLRVTVHHNLFLHIGQRAPRVRFGQVHVYNNDYVVDGSPKYNYSWGVGKESQIYAENNYFQAGEITPDHFISVLKGTRIYATGTMVNGRAENQIVDVVAEYNAVKDPDLLLTVNWVPKLDTGVDPTHRVTGLVMSGSGPFNW